MAPLRSGIPLSFSQVNGPVLKAASTSACTRQCAPGLAGYLLKDCSSEELYTAAQLLAGLHKQERPVYGPSLDISVSPEVERLGLTERELGVVWLIAQGLSNTEIAAELVVSDATVKTHINHIFSKFGARGRSKVIIKARQLGLA